MPLRLLFLYNAGNGRPVDDNERGSGMQTVNFQCGHCGNLMGVSVEFLGQQVRCPHCQQVVVAPASAGPTESTLPETMMTPAPHPTGPDNSASNTDPLTF